MCRINQEHSLPPDRRVNWRLTLGLLLSLSAHLIGAIAISSGAFRSATRPDTPSSQPDQEESRLRPGVDHSQAVTISWIGFEQPTPHQAQLAETDQPALARGPAPTPSPEPAAPTTPNSPPPSQAPAPASLTDTAQAQPIPLLPPPPHTLDELLAQLQEQRPAPSRTPAPPSTTPAPPTTTPSPADPSPPSPEAAPTPLENPAPPGGGPREASPTSRKKPIEIDPGQPVAVEGIQIDTVAPKFTTITRLTVSPKNPLIRITFSTAGKVVRAEILESSRYKDVDRPVLDAIYQWKAKGAKLDELRTKDPAQQIEFDFRIVLR